MALRVAGCMVWRVARRAPSADAQRDLAEDVPVLDPLLRLVRLRQREFRFDRHLEFRRLDGAVQPLELLDAGNGVVANDGKPGARPGFGLDSVGKGDVSARPYGVEATLECLAAAERQHRIDALRRELARRGRDVAVPPVHSRIGAEPLDESQAVLTGGGGEHFGAAQLGELQRQSPDAAGGAMNDECVSGLEVQRIIDSLDRGESRGGDRPGLPQAQSLRNVADALRRYRSEEHTSELQSRLHLVCRLLLEKKKKKKINIIS